MGYKPENKKKLISKHLEIAQERLKTAEAALNIGSYRDSISRSYYAFLDAATACLITKDLVPQSHASAIALFGLHFVKTG
ncbi:MAG: HEPN domain-containing protein [bacterium]